MIAWGPDPVVTAPAVAKSEGLLVVPSLSTLRVLEDSLATSAVPVVASTTWATGSDPVGRGDDAVDVAALRTLIPGGDEDGLSIDGGGL